MLEFGAMLAARNETISNLIRPAGYFNIKTRRLRNLLNAIASAGGMKGFFSMETGVLREALLSVNGIGPETADSICCYAAERPVFVADAYTKRMLSRHGYAEEDAGYHEIQEMFMNELDPDVRLFKDLHAYIVFIGKDYCRKRNPDCNRCPVSRIWGKPSYSVLHSSRKR